MHLPKPQKRTMGNSLDSVTKSVWIKEHDLQS